MKALPTEDIVVGHYDEGASRYDEFQTHFFDAVASNELSEAYTDLFRSPTLTEAQEILELGVGTGLNLSLYPDKTQVTGIDLSTNMLKYARNRNEALGRSVTLRQMDARALSFDPNRFDVIVSTFLLCVTTQPRTVLREASRVLRPGGHIITFEYQVAKGGALFLEQSLLRDTIRNQGLLYRGSPVISWDMQFDLTEALRDIETLRLSSLDLFQKHLFESMSIAHIERVTPPC